MNALKKKIFFGFGIVFFGFGIFGYYMPIIPGTIFMILSAYCFMYSSKRLYNKIISHPIYGKTIKLYLEENIISKKSKIIILFSIWFATLISLIFIPNIHLTTDLKIFQTFKILNTKVLLVSLSLIGTFFVLKTKNN
tara:strand:+ start:998 stop:1408 length:411 start_codon:yes stop_codon:yes gene_type:complete